MLDHGVYSGLSIALFPSSGANLLHCLSSLLEKNQTQLFLPVYASPSYNSYSKSEGIKAPMALLAWLSDDYHQWAINKAIAEKTGEILPHLSLRRCRKSISVAWDSLK